MTKNGTYVIRIHDSEGPLEERSFFFADAVVNKFRIYTFSHNLYAFSG